MLYYVGINSNVLEFTPPLTLTRDEADAGVELLDQALTDVIAGRVDVGVLSAFAGW